MLEIEKHLVFPVCQTIVQAYSVQYFLVVLSCYLWIRYVKLDFTMKPSGSLAHTH